VEAAVESSTAAKAAPAAAEASASAKAAATEASASAATARSATRSCHIVILRKNQTSYSRAISPALLLL
jgi:hypothetical protein